MNIHVRISILASGILVTLISLGCGSSGTTPPPVGAVVSTGNPLVAQYSLTHFDSGLSAYVEFGTDTNYGRQTSVATSSSSGLSVQSVTILVAGMKQKTTYHMRAHATWPGGEWVDQDQTFTTGAIPTDSMFVPQFTTSTTAANGSPAPGVELISLVNNSTPTALNAVATDLQGNVIWYCPGEAIPVKPLPSGHYMMMRGSSIDEIDLACNTIRSVTLDQINQSLQANGFGFSLSGTPPLGGLHHDMLVLPNGHWIALGQISENVTVQGYSGLVNVQGDVLMDIDPSGNVVWAWNSFDHLDVNRALFGLPDWTHSNSLVYTADGNLLLSMRNQSWILKIDYADGAGKGDILWRLGNDGDKYGQGFTLLGGDPSQWFYAQHYPVVLNVNGSQTTLAVYDDGDLRIQNGTACSPPIPPVTNCYTRATIYQIDESTNVASLLWEYSPGFFSFWGGSINVLSNNNVEFDSSAAFDFQMASLIQEVTQTDTPQEVWRMTITGSNAYRGFRVPSLYPGVTWNQ